MTTALSCAYAFVIVQRSIRRSGWHISGVRARSLGVADRKDVL
jgi:hypothetical protein